MCMYIQCCLLISSRYFLGHRLQCLNIRQLKRHKSCFLILRFRSSLMCSSLLRRLPNFRMCHIPHLPKAHTNFPRNPWSSSSNLLKDHFQFLPSFHQLNPNHYRCSHCFHLSTTSCHRHHRLQYTSQTSSLHPSMHSNSLHQSYKLSTIPLRQQRKSQRPLTSLSCQRCRSHLRKIHQRSCTRNSFHQLIRRTDLLKHQCNNSY